LLLSGVLFCGYVPQQLVRDWVQKYSENFQDARLFKNIILERYRMAFCIHDYGEGGLIYWTMGNPVDETTIISRTDKENSYQQRLKNRTLPEEKHSNG
jgi:hypothetical protein